MTNETTLAATPGDETVSTINEAEIENLGQTEKTEEKPEAKEQDAVADGDNGSDGEGEKPKKVPGSRREKMRHEQTRRELQEAYAKIEDLERRTKAAGEPEKEPQEADFNGDWQAFERARTAFEVRKVVREERQRDLEAQRSTAQSDVMRELALAHAEREEEAREAITDYDQIVAAAKDIRISPEVGREILQSDKSALLTYYLSKNPDKALALNGMTGRELAREIGRLEGSVRMPAAKKQTAAPAPLTNIKGGAAPSFDPAGSSMEEYVAKRTAGWSG